MDQVVNIIMILVGAYLLNVSNQLIKYHNLKAFYKEKNYEHIQLKYRRDYAEGIGKWLRFISLVLIISALLFFLNDYVKVALIFVAGEVVLIAGFIVGFVGIYKVNKKYEKK